MRRDFLKMRGAVDLLERAMWWIDYKPWQPWWSYPEIDKSGRHRDMEDSYQIIRKAHWNLQREIEKVR